MYIYFILFHFHKNLSRRHKSTQEWRNTHKVFSFFFLYSFPDTASDREVCGGSRRFIWRGNSSKKVLPWILLPGPGVWGLSRQDICSWKPWHSSHSEYIWVAQPLEQIKTYRKRDWKRKTLDYFNAANCRVSSSMDCMHDKIRFCPFYQHQVKPSHGAVRMAEIAPQRLEYFV